MEQEVKYNSEKNKVSAFGELMKLAIPFICDLINLYIEVLTEIYEAKGQGIDITYEQAVENVLINSGKAYKCLDCGKLYGKYNGNYLCSDCQDKADKENQKIIDTENSLTDQK